MRAAITACQQIHVDYVLQDEPSNAASYLYSPSGQQQTGERTFRAIDGTCVLPLMFCEDQTSVDMWHHAFRTHNRRSCHTLAATAETEITVEEDTVSDPLERHAVHHMFAHCSLKPSLCADGANGEVPGECNKQFCQYQDRSCYPHNA